MHLTRAGEPGAVVDERDADAAAQAALDTL